MKTCVCCNSNMKLIKSGKIDIQRNPDVDMRDMYKCLKCGTEISTIVNFRELLNNVLNNALIKKHNSLIKKHIEENSYE